MIAMVGNPEHWEHWGSLLHSVRTGETAVETARGVRRSSSTSTTNPEYATVFNDAMTGVSAMAIETAVPRYDFTDRKLIVDVGGGHGALLAAVLAAAPRAHGVLFDLPSVIDGRGESHWRRRASPRGAPSMGGSFFDVGARRRATPT